MQDGLTEVIKRRAIKNDMILIIHSAGESGPVGFCAPQTQTVLPGPAMIHNRESVGVKPEARNLPPLPQRQFRLGEV